MNTAESFEWTSMVVGVATIADGAIRLLSYATVLAPLPGFPRVSSPPSAWATASIVLLGCGLVGLSRRSVSLPMRLAVVGAALLAAIASFGGVLTLPSPGIAAMLAELRATILGVSAILLASVSLLVRARARESAVAGLLAVMVVAIGFVAALGYIYGGPLLTGLGWAPVKLTSALATVLIGLGLVTVGGPTAWPNRLFVGNSVKTVMLRWLIPVMALAIVATNFATAQLFALFPHAVGSAFNTLVAVAATALAISYLGRTIGGRLERAEEHFTRVFRSVPAGLAISQLEDGTVIEVNDAFERIFGCSRADVLGRKSPELGLWADASDRARFARRVAGADGEVSGEELNMRALDGRALVICVSGQVVEFRNQRVLLTTFVDVTEQRTAEREARAALTERRRRNERTLAH